MKEITENYKYNCNYLDEKVSKMKNELIIFLKEINNVVLSCENVFKATENYNIISDNFDIKTLFYISEIYKINEKAQLFFKKPIRNLDLNLGSFIEHKNNLFMPTKYDYNYYYFSGVATPKSIGVCKNNKKLLIKWDMDEQRIKGDIKYNILIKLNDEEFKYESILIY